MVIFHCVKSADFIMSKPHLFSISTKYRFWASVFQWHLKQVLFFVGPLSSVTSMTRCGRSSCYTIFMTSAMLRSAARRLEVRRLHQQLDARLGGGEQRRLGQ